MESVYQTRRARLTADLQDGDVFVLFSGDSETPSILPSDPKTVSKNFIYLTGLCENDLVLVIIRSGGAVREALFVPARSDMEAFYMGKTKDLDYYRQRRRHPECGLPVSSGQLYQHGGTDQQHRPAGVGLPQPVDPDPSHPGGLLCQEDAELLPPFAGGGQKL